MEFEVPVGPQSTTWECTPQSAQCCTSLANTNEYKVGPTSTTWYVESCRYGLRLHLIAVKDNICTSELPTTCASSILQGFKPRQGAEAVRRLQNNGGALVVVKANMDEFGMGSHSTHSVYGPVQNLIGNAARSAGGSSGGSAVAVATDQCYLALGTDTGGSVRLPAAYTGLAGFKPSYGMISRQGVVPYANSLDTVGVIARSCFDILHTFSEYWLNPRTSSMLTEGRNPQHA
jgi:Asp-tRNA(Asn)/Glu-tRNA(Gln) amidotransferase A subunit family amidase